MKKINRMLSFLMALALLFSLAPAAYADVGDENRKAKLLTQLGILGDDSSESTAEISNVEIAETLTRAALGGQYNGEEIAAMYGKYENPYTDVSDEQWAKGHISYVHYTGTVEGRDRKSFGNAEWNLDGAPWNALLDLSQNMQNTGINLWYLDMFSLKWYYLPDKNTFSGRIPDVAVELENNVSLESYNDRGQASNQDAARTVVEADLIPTYNHQRLYNLYVGAPYTWSDAAQLIATLELGEEEAAKLEDPVEYCRGKGYIPEGQERQHPLTGADLVKILSTLMGNKVWLPTSAGQFASIFGLLEGASGILAEANTDLETLEDHTELNKLLAHPLNRDNAMTMIYNFLKAADPNGEGTVAERFGVDLEDYRYQRRNTPVEEVVFHTTTVIPAGTTVNVAVDNQGDITVTQGGDEVSGTDGESIDDIAVNTYAVQVDSPITVETLGHIITEIIQHNTNGASTTIFHIDDASTWGNVDGYTITVEETNSGSVFSGSTVTYVPTGDGDYHIHTQESVPFTEKFMSDVQADPDAGDGLVGLPEFSSDLKNTEDENMIEYDENSADPVLNPGEYELDVGDEAPKPYSEDPEPEGGPPAANDPPAGTPADTPTGTPADTPTGDGPAE